VLDPLFKPRSIAIIGASSNPLSIGHMVLKNLLDHHFRGSIYLVNPNAASIGNFKTYPSILDIPDDVDLVNISIARARVPAVLEECGRKGAKFAIIHTAGFKETGEEGRALERQIVEIGRRYGLRICGPNAQGIQNSDESVSVYANFTFTPMSPGNISIAAQSGGVGETLKVHLSRAGLGIRLYASTGNEADVGLNEIVEYFGKDPETRVILIHVETFKDPAGFLAAAGRITPKKPILALKTGRTSEGSKAAASHTGSLVEQDLLSELIFRKSGVLRFSSQEEMIDAAQAFSLQLLPRGNRVAIVTNTGGPAVIAVDECLASGLVPAELSRETRETLGRIVFQEAIVTNPVDLVATAGPDQFGGTIEALIKDPQVDSLLLIFVTAPFVDYLGIARRIGDLAGSSAKPIVSQVITNETGAEVLRTIAKARIPVFGFTEAAVRALAALTRYGIAVRRVADTEYLQGRGKGSAAARIGRYAGTGTFLRREDVFELLRDYDIPTATTLRVKDREDLVRVAQRIGYPLVLKVDGETIVHKTDVGGVALNLKTPDELLAAHDKMSATFSGNDRAFSLQKYLAGGKEIILGIKGNDGLAPTLMFGLGGVFVEALKDVQFRLAPLSRTDALDMIRSIRGFSILEGRRGEKPADIPWLAEILARLSALALDFPLIDELDLNPVLVFEEGRGGMAVDARVKVK
jgi:acyl-CoA synthetase (NDP forming)